MRASLWAMALGTCFVCGGDVRASSSAGATPAASALSARTGVRSPDALSRVGVGFVENAGRWDAAVRAYANCPGYELFLTDREAVLAFADDGPVRLGFPRAAATAPSDERPGRVNFLLGNDPAKWTRNARHFGSVLQRGVAEGVDLAWTLQRNGARFDVRVAAGADVDALALTLRGTRGVRADGDGTLRVMTARGALRASPPVAWQEEPDGSRRAVEARWCTHDGARVGFVVAGRDPARALVIDPTLTYATVFGGSGAESMSPVSDSRLLAVGPDGAAYVAGITASSDFPTSASALDRTREGADDPFVAKLDPTGVLVYATLLGGTSSFGERIEGIDADANGSAYVTGQTPAADFPTTAGAFDTTHGGDDDVFVSKLSPSGDSLLYSTFLGGSLDDQGMAIVVDRTSGVAWVAGSADSADFPAVNSIRPPSTLSGAVFVAKLAADGASLLYSTLFASGRENNLVLAVDGSGSAFVAGQTTSTNLPVTPGAFQSSRDMTGSQPVDGFVCKIVPQGNAFVYMTYLGGSGREEPHGVAPDSSGRLVIYGRTSDGNFPPASPGAFQSARKSSHNYFVVRLAADGSGLDWATYLGGSGGDLGSHKGGLALDGDGNVLVASQTQSDDFPVKDALQSERLDGQTVFLTKLSADGTTLLFSTYLGGSGGEQGAALGLDPEGNAIVMGTTFSSDFPSTATSGPRGAGDVFVAKIDLDAAGPGPGDEETLDVVITKGKLGDSATAGKDAFKAKGTFVFNAKSPDSSFDFATDALALTVGGGAGTFTLNVAAADAGWKSNKKGKLTWKSAKGSLPAAKLAFDPVKKTFAVKVAKFDFAAAPANSVGLDLSFGNDSGSTEAAWTVKKPGSLKFP